MNRFARALPLLLCLGCLGAEDTWVRVDAVETDGDGKTAGYSVFGVMDEADLQRLSGSATCAVLVRLRKTLAREDHRFVTMPDYNDAAGIERDELLIPFARIDSITPLKGDPRAAVKPGKPGVDRF